ncbi:trimeric intracellular cation channel family protein [Peptoniphilus equinus]|uniref:Trimeric intracellular cation channel family protein n=1 Tax=Peptoniphilus equinus TaxID=3016343 RepID=A0ABY7QUY0_9FIRM|nr:trimeric intracellular cation channel family protein [Peptoniphilus equinus]WBW49708.1 trimeric intracellular cation channel family protein [Peptoniphilus equinus]
MPVNLPVIDTMNIVLETVGTIAFAFSGAMLGIRGNMDLMGTLVLGLTTALGGGATRDIFLGYNPPSMFRDTGYVKQAVVASLIVFIICYLRQEIISSRAMARFERAMVFFDALGLGAFTVTGMNQAIALGFREHWFLVVFCGLLTAVGGGVIRDIFADRTPTIFQEQIYASAALIGAVVYMQFFGVLPQNVLMLITAMIVVVVRMVSVYKDVGLPKIK